MVKALVFGAGIAGSSPAFPEASSLISQAEMRFFSLLAIILI